MPTQDLDKFKQILKDGGARVTKSRVDTFKLFSEPEPMAMRQLLEAANGKIDRVSVYRSLDLFEKLGIVQRLNIGWKHKFELSDMFKEHHHHLSCISCGKVIDIEDEAHIDEFIDSVASKANFTPRRHQFEVDGYCEACV